MIHKFLGALVIMLFILSLAVTVVPLLTTLCTVPRVDVYLPGVRKVTTSPIWIRHPSLSKNLGWDTGPLCLAGLIWSPSCSVSLASYSSSMSAVMQRLLICSCISSMSGLSFIWMICSFLFHLE